MGSSQIAVYTDSESMQRQPVSADSATKEFPHQRVMQNGQSVVVLQERLEEIERRLKNFESSGGGVESDSLPVAESAISTQPVVAELQTQLRTGGFSEDEYDVITNLRDELQLKRLQLRDRAIREGWFRSESWVQQSRDLDTDTALRKKLGDDRFEDYLTATGRDNRVKIDDVMAGSAAEQAGILPGDLIHRYADRRVYLSEELRNMTTDGEAGEPTALTVLRGGELLDLSVPRGPLGVIISGIPTSPGNQ